MNKREALMKRKARAAKRSGEKDITITGVDIELNKKTPDVMTPDVLRQELEAIGLACDQINDASLTQYIDRVREGLPQGKWQTYWITRANNPLGEITEQGHWEPGGAGSVGQYQTELSVVVEENNFNTLAAADLEPPFCGISVEPVTTTESTPTEDAVMDLFVEIATNASAALIEGLDREDMEAILTNVIQAQDINLKDYSYTDSRVIYLVEDYDPNTHQCKAIGAEVIEWSIYVKDYKEKDKDNPNVQSTMTVSCRAVEYADISLLYRDYYYILSLTKMLPPRSSGDQRIVIEPVPLWVYDSLPSASSDTFIHSLPIVVKDGLARSNVLYAPELVNIACLDNTQSTADTTYSISITVGFSKGQEFAFDYGVAMSVGFEFFGAEASYGFEASFNSQYNAQIEEKVTVHVPAGQKAFIYQANILTKVLIQTTTNGDTYEWEGVSTDGNFLTKEIVTSTEPLVALPAPLHPGA